MNAPQREGFQVPGGRSSSARAGHAEREPSDPVELGGAAWQSIERLPPVCAEQLQLREPPRELDQVAHVAPELLEDGDAHAARARTPRRAREAAEPQVHERSQRAEIGVQLQLLAAHRQERLEVLEGAGQHQRRRGDREAHERGERAERARWSRARAARRGARP